MSPRGEANRARGSKTTHKTSSQTTHKTSSKTTHKTSSKTTHRTSSKTTHKTRSKTPHKTSSRTTHKTTSTTTPKTSSKTTQHNKFVSPLVFDLFGRLHCLSFFPCHKLMRRCQLDFVKILGTSNLQLLSHQLKQNTRR